MKAGSLWEYALTRRAVAGEDFPEEVLPELSLEEYVSQVKVWGVPRQKEPSVQGHGRQEGMHV